MKPNLGVKIHSRVTTTVDSKDLQSLLEATYHRKIAITSFLLKQGANVNAVDMYGKTAMHYILKDKHYSSKGLTIDGNIVKKFIRLFIDNGADLTIKDVNGKSVFDFCKEHEYGDYVLNYLAVVEKKKSKMKSRKFKLEDCIICNIPRQEIFALYPCGHARSCKSCCLKLLYSKTSNFRCYMCRTVISDYKKIYF